MNTLPPHIKEAAQREAIYNVYMYLPHEITPAENAYFHEIVAALHRARRYAIPYHWSERERRRLNLLEAALDRDPALAVSRIGNITRSESGLNACTFTASDGAVSVVFRGTAKGEWIDNGEALSGIPEDNTYITYGKNGRIASYQSVAGDFAADQQVEALNWFRYTAAVNDWTSNTAITVSGHSKGGNKAQFVALHSPLVHLCCSFDGQGFSPEALAALRAKLGDAFDQRCRHIYSLCGDNDYVHVLGRSVVPPSQVYHLKTVDGFHYMESLLDETAALRQITSQGALSDYIAAVSEELMQLPPAIRHYATRGVMNVLQRTVGNNTPVNGDTVSLEDTIAGLAVTLGAALQNLPALHELTLRTHLPDKNISEETKETE